MYTYYVHLQLLCVHALKKVNYRSYHSVILWSKDWMYLHKLKYSMCHRFIFLNNKRSWGQVTCETMRTIYWSSCDTDWIGPENVSYLSVCQFCKCLFQRLNIYSQIKIFQQDCLIRVFAPISMSMAKVHQLLLVLLDWPYTYYNRNMWQAHV